MEKRYGLWIDHEKATIVKLMGGNHQIMHIASNIEGRYRLKGGSRSDVPYGIQRSTSENKRDLRYRKHLNIYFEKIIDLLKDAKKIYIFGPGEAKIELQKKIEHDNKHLSNKLSLVETTDKLTESQIIEKIKNYFNET